MFTVSTRKRNGLTGYDVYGDSSVLDSRASYVATTPEYFSHGLPSTRRREDGPSSTWRSGTSRSPPSYTDLFVGQAVAHDLHTLTHFAGDGLIQACV